LGTGPLLVGAAGAGVLLDVGAVAGAEAGDVEAFAAVLVDDADVAAAGVLELPLLVAAAVPGPLFDLGVVRGGGGDDVDDLAAVAVGHAVYGRRAGQVGHRQDRAVTAAGAGDLVQARPGVEVRAGGGPDTAVGVLVDPDAPGAVAHPQHGRS